VGEKGTILTLSAAGSAPFVRGARLNSDWNSNNVELLLDLEGARGSEAIGATGLNDYDFAKGVNRPWPDEKPCTKDPKTSQWRCTVDKTKLQPQVTSGAATAPKVHFRITLHHDWGSDTYDFSALYDPWSPVTAHPVRTAAIASAIVLLALPTFFLFVRPLWNIRIYRALKLSRIEKIEIPGIGAAIQVILRLVFVLPWFIKRRRTLDAWVQANRGPASQSWLDEAGTELYVPLPVRQGDPRSGTQTMQPSAGDFRNLIAPPRTTIQIVGPGGAGKTSLARQLRQWCLENGPNSGIAPYPMLPVWVDEELGANNTLCDVVRGKLTAALPNEEIDDVLFSGLLEKQRLMVFVDRLSERSSATQQHIQTIYRSARIGLLIVTSRTLHQIDGAQGTRIYPQPLNSATLLRFMTDLLSASLSGDGESGPFSGIKEQCALGERLAALIRLRTESGEEDIPLIPLPVKLFVEQAVALVREGKSIDDLPVSLPEVYFRHLRLVNPQDPALPHYIHNDRMVKVAKTLAKTALGANFIPKEFTRSAALAALSSAGETVTAACDPVERLKLNGILKEKQGGMDVQLRFELDPVAEILAAAAYGDDCGHDPQKWAALLEQSATAPGFQSALKLVRQSYWQ
jgi:hypothetical protein